MKSQRHRAATPSAHDHHRPRRRTGGRSSIPASGGFELTPIHGTDGKVVGTFANYYRPVREIDRELTDLITTAAARVIERAAAEPNRGK